MINIDDYKEAKECKDIMDIISEYSKTDYLLNNRDYPALQQHLSEVLRKHPIEVAAYNAVNVKPVENNLHQQGINCMNFLENLFRAKLAEKGLKYNN